MRIGESLNHCRVVFFAVAVVAVGTLGWGAFGFTDTSAAEGDKPAEKAKAAPEYIDAVDLLPKSTAGMLRIPKLPDFCNAWTQTNIGQLLASPDMQPFLDAQRERASTYLDSLDRKIGVKPSDLYDMASGEVVAAWVSFPDDDRRPYALCVIADVRGMRADADAAGKKIDEELIAGGAVRRDVKYGDEVIRVYQTKRKPGQLKIEEIALTWNDDRFIAADRDSVVQGLLDIVAGKSPGKQFTTRPNYQQVKKDSYKALAAADEKRASVCWEWFAEPFAMGRILREVFEYDRQDDLDIMQLLERQGFTVIEALGGVGVVAGDRFDVLHRGVVIAPGKLVKAARMLRAFNTKREPIPDFPTEDAGAFYRISWKLEDAFWAAESLVNDALGEDLFRPMIDGIKNDPEGPQIDLAKDFLPNLDDEVILVTDNTMPASPESDRMLVALRVKNADVVKRVIKKAMEVEPDASKLDVAEFDVWRVEKGEGDEDLDAELELLGFGEELEEEEGGRLLNHWAIAVVEGNGPNDPDYLMFSSHSDLLIKLGKRVRSGAGDGMATTEETKKVVKAMDELKADETTFFGVTHPSISLRARYELLRKGELKDSETVVANLLRRMVDENEEGEPDPIQAAKLPPFAKIKDFLKAAGTFWEQTENGWAMTGFLLAE